MKNIMMTIMVGLFLIGTACSAKAAVLLPGALFVAPSGAVAPAGTFVTSLVDNFTGTDINNTVYFTGTLDEAVLTNSTGMLFEYSFINNSSSIDAITQLATLGYSNYSVNADALSAGILPGSPSVNGMDRSAGAGDVVTFGWIANPVNPGQSSGSFWIQTDAPTYQAATTQLIGGGIATMATDGPAGLPAATPEPASMALLGMGFIGLIGLKRPRSV